MPTLALTAGIVIVALLGAFGLLLVWSILTDRVKLRGLLSEEKGKASMSRFQLLIFTFVVAMCVLVLTLESGEFPRLSAEILGLLGISGAGYVISKGIQTAGDKPAAPSGPTSPAGGGHPKPPTAPPPEGTHV